MAEKEPQFIVTDRRKFTSEGELREGAEWSPEEPVVEEAAKVDPPLWRSRHPWKPQPGLAW